MIARAPGKLVLSGAYSVLEGAVAIVCSVDLHAQADTSAPPDRVTAEVAEAIAAGVMRAAPWFDATPLRARLSDGRDIKLGVGSSAAILAASMAADWAESGRPLDRDALFEASLAAHRKAQGGGSGIDVAASVHGGFLTCTLAPDGRLTVAPHTFPGAAHIHVFATPVAASTPELLGRVRAFAAKDPPAYTDLIDRAGSAAAEAAAAADPPALLRALRAQS
ncbi:MAG: hypothetical protein R3F14_15570, partial [Polyangiaceae bacterium]